MIVNGNDWELADGLTNHGCWSQIRNQSTGGAIPGEFPGEISFNKPIKM